MSIARVAAWLDAARRVLVITGAGLSAESGLPTYRGVGGLYQDRNATEEGVPIEVALSGQMLLDNPDLCWRHIARIEAACRGALPNSAHRAIARLERPGREVCVLTQNVDGLHAAAGSTRVIDLHGDVHKLACTRCAWRLTTPDYAHLTLPPACPACGHLVRPEVVLFGEQLPLDKLWTLRQELRQGFDLVLSVGTTSVFPYIAQPVLDAARQGTPTVEINPGDTEVSHAVAVRLRTGAALAFQALEDALNTP